MARKKTNFFKKKISGLMQKKLVMLFGAIILAFVFLIGWITYINASKGEKYTKVVLDQQQYNNRTIPFKRGDIVDRNGTKLATSERVYNVVVDAKTITSNKKYINPTIKALSKCFDLKKKDVRKQIKKNPNSRYLVLKKGVNYEAYQKFEKITSDTDKNPNVQGVWMEEDYTRKYPYKTLASDVIGFTTNGNVGSNGIEASYNSVLNGTDGREYGYLDEDSGYERTVKEPDNGSTVVSTIDLQVQSIVEQHILEFNEEHKNEATQGEGSKNTGVIVMNPQNGEILAEASYPNYDLNNPRDLTKYYTEEQLKKMTDQEKLDTLNDLWNNYCVSNTYEPGSTFKPFTISAGLETGVLTGNENYVCGGVMHVGDHDIHCSNRSGHGPETLKQALENSCNVALMQIGASIGTEEFCRYQRLFGFGEYTGIDLPGEGETSGLLYTPATMDPASLATNAFGQNFNVTMTQMAASFSSLINGGNYYEPHVVKQIQDDNGNIVYAECSMDKKYRPKDIESPKDISENYYLVRRTMKDTGWNFYIYRPKAVSENAIHKLLLKNIPIILISVLLLSFLGYVFSLRMVSQLELLTENMNLINMGLRKVTVQSKSKDEVGVLIQSFRRMMDQMNHLISEVYESKIQLQNSEMRALQAQINPHFLYNSLSIINWKAIEAGEDEISHVTLALSTYYRTSLNRGETMTTVAKEIDNIRAYLKIQLVMHDNEFRVVEQISDGLNDYLIPKLILQPLAENAIDHGIDVSDNENPTLWLTIREEAEHIFFEIRDNGAGMTQEKADQILTYQSSGYGVRNVCDRIHVLYGEKGEMKIESTPGKGTRVFIRIPKNTEAKVL
jgi:stage V sporulation protein D (sporulation-specific penicillin-binding protein)